MASVDTWGLVPVKRFSRSKLRLSGLLSASERAHLARTMLHDVLGHLRETKSLAGVVVVSADPEVQSVAAAFGAGMIFDMAESGLNDAVRRGLDALLPYRRQVFVVPADIPFAGSVEFESVIALLEYNHVVLSPATSDGGTNALAMRSPDLLSPQFGADSFSRHRASARGRALCCGVLRSPGIGRDIDCPEDLGPHLTSAGNDSLTSSLLKELGIADRLGMYEVSAQKRLIR